MSHSSDLELPDWRELFDKHVSKVSVSSVSNSQPLKESSQMNQKTSKSESIPSNSSTRNSNNSASSCSGKGVASGQTNTTAASTTTPTYPSSQPLPSSSSSSSNASSRAKSLRRPRKIVTESFDSGDEKSGDDFSPSQTLSASSSTSSLPTRSSRRQRNIVDISKDRPTMTTTSNAATAAKSTSNATKTSNINTNTNSSIGINGSSKSSKNENALPEAAQTKTGAQNNNTDTKVTANPTFSSSSSSNENLNSSETTANASVMDIDDKDIVEIVETIKNMNESSKMNPKIDLMQKESIQETVPLTDSVTEKSGNRSNNSMITKITKTTWRPDHAQEKRQSPTTPTNKQVNRTDDTLSSKNDLNSSSSPQPEFFTPYKTIPEAKVAPAAESQSLLNKENPLNGSTSTKQPANFYVNESPSRIERLLAEIKSPRRSFSATPIKQIGSSFSAASLPGSYFNGTTENNHGIPYDQLIQPSQHGEALVNAMKRYVSQVAYEQEIQYIRSSTSIESNKKTLTHSMANLSHKIDELSNTIIPKCMDDVRKLELKTEEQINMLKNELHMLKQELNGKNEIISNFNERMNMFQELLKEKQTVFEKISKETLDKIGADLAARMKREEMNEEMFKVAKKRLSEVELFADNQRIDNENIRKTMRKIEEILVERFEEEHSEVDDRLVCMEKDVEVLVNEVNRLKSSMNEEPLSDDSLLTRKRKKEQINNYDDRSEQFSNKRIRSKSSIPGILKEGMRWAVSGVAAAMWLANSLPPPS